MDNSVRHLLERELASLKVVFYAKGVKREDGKTAAEVEEELRQKNTKENA